MTDLRNKRRYRSRDESAKAQDFRTEAQRDFDRVSGYSNYYQRLANKTQIIAPDNTPEVTHSRLTHANKVSQMARTIALHLIHVKRLAEEAEKFGGIDPDVCAAAAAAHDIGHPPFGHVGEEVLDEFARDRDLSGFQGNAQSFRIVSKLDIHPQVVRGLDLSFATLNAIQKYPWTRGHDVSDFSQLDSSKHWGLYPSEKKYADIAREALPSTIRHRPCLESQIMDFADDITYALHDFEDFYRLGLISVRRIVHANGFVNRKATHDSLHGRHPDLLDSGEWYSAVDRVVQFLEEEARPIHERFQDRRDQESTLREMTSHWLSRWLDRTSIDDAGLYRDIEAWHEIMVLKIMAYEQVIEHPRVKLVQEGHRSILHELLHRLESALLDRSVMPTRLEEYLNLSLDDPDSEATQVQATARSLLDYVAWLTEPQAAMMLKLTTGQLLDFEASGWVR